MNFTSILGDSLPTDIKIQAKTLAELIKKRENTEDELKRMRILSESVSYYVAMTIDKEDK